MVDVYQRRIRLVEAVIQVYLPAHVLDEHFLYQLLDLLSRGFELLKLGVLHQPVRYVFGLLR